MVSLGDCYILHAILIQEVKQVLPLPATVDLAALTEDGDLHPLPVHPSVAPDPATAEMASAGTPRLLDDRLILPLLLPYGEQMAVVISDVDPAFLRKMSSSWLRETMADLFQRFEQTRLGYIDPETDVYNRRAASVFLTESAADHPGFFLLVNTVFYRRTAAGTLQKLREIADLLQALTQTHCFSFGSGVFGLLLPLASREQVLKTAHYLQRQLKREGMNKVQIGFAPVSFPEKESKVKILDRCWLSLDIAEKRGPFGICETDAINEELPHPFQLSQSFLSEKLRKSWRGLSHFTLVMLSRQPGFDQVGALDGGVIQSAGQAGQYLGEEENLAVFLFPGKDPAVIDQGIEGILKSCRDYYGRETVALGVASWPCLDFTKSEIPGNCLKALLHGSFLGPGALVVFDHLSLNISGDLFFDEGDHRAAIREYRRGLRLQPGDVNLINSLGVTLIECHQERQAADCFQEVLQKEPDNYMALVNLGYVQQSFGCKELALDCFERAYRRLTIEDATAQELFLPLGKLYAELGNHEKAVAVFERWRSLPGSEKEFLLFRLLGQAYLESGNPDAAIRASQRALQLFPQDSISLSILGLLYVEQGEGSEVGLALCRKALALDNFNPDHWYRLGRALLCTGNHAEARTAAGQCLQLRRNHVDGLLLLGSVQRAMGQEKRSRRCFLQAMGHKGCTEKQAKQARKFLERLSAP